MPVFCCVVYRVLSEKLRFQTSFYKNVYMYICSIYIYIYICIMYLIYIIYIIHTYTCYKSYIYYIYLFICIYLYIIMYYIFAYIYIYIYYIYYMAISALRMGVILLGPLLVNLYVYSSSFYLATVQFLWL